MRVLCINGTKPGQLTDRGIPHRKEDVIKEGKEYNITEHETVMGEECYRLAEKLASHVWYRANRFIPLSDIDETERIDEILEKLFVPVKIKI